MTWPKPRAAAKARATARWTLKAGWTYMVVLRCERPPELGHGAGVEKMCRRADSGGTGDDHTRSRARAARVRRRRNSALRAIVVMGSRYRRQAGVRQAHTCTSAQADASGAALFQSRHDLRRSDGGVQIVG